MGFLEHRFSDNILSGKLNKMLARGRSGSIWIYRTHLGCCQPVTELLDGKCRDLKNQGIHFVNTPRLADAIILPQFTSEQLLPYILQACKQIPEPCYTILMGQCEPDNHTPAGESQSRVLLEKHIGIDIRVPGCPPGIDAILTGLQTLQEWIRGENWILRI